MLLRCLRRPALFSGIRTVRPYSTKGKLEDDDDLNFDAVDILKKPNSDEDVLPQFQPFDWFKVFNSPPTEPKKLPAPERVKNLQSELLKYTSMESIEKLVPDFLTAFNNSLSEFGDRFLQDAVAEDETLHMIAEQEGKETAYYQAVVGLLKGQTDIQILNMRLQTPREEVEEGLYSRFVASLSEKEDKFNIQTVLEEYAKFPVPRAKHMQPEHLETFLEHFKMYCLYLSPELVNLVFQDVIDSGMMITQEELVRSLSCTLASNEDFEEDTYRQYKQVFTGSGFELNVDAYNMLLTACVVARNSALFDKILAEMNEDGVQPNRTTFQLMADHCGNVKDTNRLLNLLEMRLVQIPLFLDPNEIATFANALLNCGEQQLAKDMVGVPLLVRDLCIHHNELDVSSYDGNSLEDQLHMIPYNSPLDMFDFLTRDQRLFMFYPDIPEWTFDVFAEHADSFKEIQDVVQNARSNSIGISIPVATKYMELFYQDRKRLRMDLLRNVTDELLSSTQEKALYLISNPQMVQLVVNLGHHFVQTGELPNDDVTKRALKELQSELDTGAALKSEDALDKRLRNVSYLLNYSLESS
ncbi:hypothetical protein KL943_003146 [Ogataea angusta]|nr:hypothetical protein KL943_003146 [Ogataea angusta]